MAQSNCLDFHWPGIYSMCLGELYTFGYVDSLYQHGVYANSMFWMWLVALPLSQAIFNNHLSLRTRIFVWNRGDDILRLPCPTI